jgi:hypothetical protein
MKQMLIVITMLAVMVTGLAAPAMAEEVQNPPNDPPPVEEEPYKDPGIRQCDLSPTPCENTDDSSDEHGHSSVADPDADDTDPVEEEPKEEEASAPGAGEVPGVITTTAQENDASAAPKAVIAPDEAGQTPDSGTIYGACAYEDYDYVEELDACLPNEPFFEVVLGDAPWPDSAGGYVGLLGQFVGDVGTGLGIGLDQGLGYLGDTLVEFGEGGGPIGWAIQGAGYTLGFLGEAGGVLSAGVSQGVDAVVEGVGEAVDAIGDAAGAAWDEVSSWW